jgi:hypothetical protein
MKKIIQDENGKKMIMNVISSMPTLPDGWSDLGLADDLPEAIVEIEAANTLASSKAADLQFLKDSDWKIMRNLREVTLGQTPSLSNEELLALETLRSEAAARI